MELAMREEILSSKLVKNEDLNHHSTLYAGRMAEWLVESAYIAAASLLNTRSLVCLRIHDMRFIQPAHAGDLLRFISRPVLNGRSSLLIQTEAKVAPAYEKIMSGFITFIHIDANGSAISHGCTVTAETTEEKALQQLVRSWS